MNAVHGAPLDSYASAVGTGNPSFPCLAVGRKRRRHRQAGTVLLARVRTRIKIGCNQIVSSGELTHAPPPAGCRHRHRCHADTAHCPASGPRRARSDAFHNLCRPHRDHRDVRQAVRHRQEPGHRAAAHHQLRTDGQQDAALVQGRLAIAQAIIAGASLSFFGLGQQPPAAAWGSLLNAAQRHLRWTRRFRIARTSASAEWQCRFAALCLCCANA